jgi:DNA helicase INO80
MRLSPTQIEEDVFVNLSYRQRMMYKALVTNFGTAELLARAASASTDAESARALSNLAMQFRKVCNHPELFERADVRAPFSFCEFGQSGPFNREGDVISAPYSTRNPIEVSVPELFYLDGGLLHVPCEDALMKSGPGPLAALLNIWSVELICRSLYEDGQPPHLNMPLRADAARR